ncbi:MAG: hypothetical protein BGO31_05255, partial [Bacteroidetes bacterium 43-16]
GTSILLKVMAGDKIAVNAENFYEQLQSQPEDIVSSEAVMSQVLNAMAGGAAATTGSEGAGANILNTNTDPAALQSAYEALQAAETDSSKPRSYLNYLFFDEHMKVVAGHSRLWQADGAADWKTIGTEEAIEIPENGYIAVYLSNQGAEQVYFDNLAVTVTPGALLEERHYYPYGLPIKGWGTTATSSLPNRQRYQGNEYREEAGLNWMDFHNRQYDPQLGRFLALDALADMGGQQVLSPYHAMGCNPAMMVDPLGLRSDVFDNGSRPVHTADVPIPMWPVNTNARFALLDQMMYADQDAFHEWVKNQLIAEAAGEEAFAVLNALDYGLSLLGFESKSISAALGRSTTVAGEASNQSDSYYPELGSYSGHTYPFPSDGIFKLGIYSYDLNSFIDFFNKYAKKFGNPVFSTSEGSENMDEPYLNGQPTKLYAEVSSYLTENLDMQTMSIKISFSDPNPKSGRKGTSGYFNRVNASDAFVPYKNQSAVRIHLHPFGGKFSNLSFIAQRNPFGGSPRYGNIMDFGAAKPSMADHNNAALSNFYYRYVVINSAYIYLYNKNPNETIRINRP